MSGYHTTICHCTFCGKEGHWGRFGHMLGLYLRSQVGFDRVAWICPDCRKKFFGEPGA